MEDKTNYLINEQKCRLTQTLHSDWNTAWNYVNSTNNVGCCSYLYNKYGRPDNYQTFYDYYVTDKQTDNPKECGRNETQINNMCMQLQQHINYTADNNDLYDFYVKKVIIDTLDGCKWENKAYQWISTKSNGELTVKPPQTYMQDVKEGIDGLIYDANDNLKGILQVKPNTFFIGNYNQSLNNDRKLAFKKESICKDKYNVKTYVMVYNKKNGEWVTDKNGKALFQYSDFLNQYGYSNNNIKNL